MSLSSLSVVSAPGKVILFGEHSILYGHKAISLAIPLRTTITKEILGKGQGFVFHCLPGNDVYEIPSPFGNNSLLSIVFHTLYSLFYKGFRIKVTIRTDIPIGCGLGSSAALCNCLAAVFLDSCDLEDIYDISIKLENIFHGKSSGIDIKTSLYGGFILSNSCNGKVLSHSIREIQKLPSAFYIINTNIESSTKDMVTMVRGKSHTLEDQFKDIDNMIDKFDIGIGIRELNSSIRECQSILSRKFGISNTLIDELIAKLEEEEIYFKITGSGGGGCLIGGFGVQNQKRIEEIASRIIPKSMVIKIDNPENEGIIFK